jgi:hypothetical protein
MSNSVSMDLGKTGDQNFFSSIFRLGRYMTRQWEFSVMNDCDIIIMEAEEDIEVLDR